MSHLPTSRTSRQANDRRRKIRPISEGSICLAPTQCGSEPIKSCQGRRLRLSAPSDYLYLDYVRELDACSKQIKPNELVYKLNRYLIRVLSFIACLDPDPINKPQQQSFDNTKQSSACNNSGRFCNLIGPLISYSPLRIASLARKLMLFLQYLFVSHLLMILYYHYMYDFDLMRLKRIREKSDGNPFGTKLAGRTFHNTSEAELELTERMQATKAILDIIGAPYLHISIIMETIYLFVISLWFLSFHIMFIYYKFVAVLDFHIIRDNLNYELESKRLKKLIESQVDRFAISENGFAESQSKKSITEHSKFPPNQIHYLRESKPDTMSLNFLYPERRASRRPSMQAEGTSRLSDFRDESKISRHFGQQHRAPNSSSTDNLSILARMLDCGALLPANRSVNWTEKRIKLTFWGTVFSILYLVLFYTSIRFISVLEKDPNRLNKVGDTLNHISTIAMVFLVSAVCILWGVYSIMAAVDQVILINKLLELTEQCIRINSIEFPSCHFGTSSELVAGTGTLPAAQSKVIIEETSDWTWHKHRVADKLNTNLLFILMHYKIFVAQCKPVMKSLDTLLIVVNSIAMLIPIIVRLHLPYLNMFREKDIRFFTTGLSCALMVSVDYTVLPLCYFHSRCEDLYRALSSLLAHVIEIENIEPNGRNMYNQHPVLLLRKELSDPNRFVQQFRSRFSRLSGTYTTMIKVHFWWGLIVISIIMDVRLTGQGSFDSFFNDPLGVF